MRKIVNQEFNLLDEPWILVLDQSGTMHEINLVDALVHAHEYKCLAGELPTQNFAILRLLLAVMQTVVYRYDDGTESEIRDSDDALKRWKKIWDSGELPAETIESYLNKWNDRFWLIHPDRPFYQVPEAICGTHLGAKQLNGELSESNNKETMNLFAGRSGLEYDRLTYSEAARWLVHFNGYSANSTKAKWMKGVEWKGSEKPSVHVGWLGQLYGIYAEGHDLFETIMLNLVLVHDKTRCWTSPKPIWERPEIDCKGLTEILVPDNQAELLTLQSRCVALEHQDGYITGLGSVGAYFFQASESEYEMMTLWRIIKGKKDQISIIPMSYPRGKQMWRSFANTVTESGGASRPGIVLWLKLLQEKGLISKRPLRFKSSGASYKSQQKSSIEDIYGDQIEFHSSLLTKGGEKWAYLISEEIERCDSAAGHLGTLVNSVLLASGVRTAKGTEKSIWTDAKFIASRERWIGRFYDEIDIPFRRWIAGIDPNENLEPDAVRLTWWNLAVKIALRIGTELVDQAGDVAFRGRNVDFGNGITKYYASPEAYGWFRRNVKACFTVEKGEEESAD